MHTSHKWTEQNGVVGFVFISGNTSLFLPAAGNRFRGDLYSAGIYGNYWSSSLYPSYSGYAWGFDFYSDDCGMNSFYRRYGFSVRPVTVCSSQN